MLKLSPENTRHYETLGYCHLRGVLEQEVLQGILAFIKTQIVPERIDLSRESFPDILDRATLDIYGPRFAPLKFLLWGLTPFMAEATGRNLAPTYNFFRIYRSGDVCRLHTDRPACDHSMSLTLAYSDGLAWPFDVMPRGTTPATAADDGARSTRFAMAAGDAILYRGVEVPHGRATANPNGWSAHLFLHWVDLDGPYRDQAFDREQQAETVDFAFA